MALLKHDDATAAATAAPSSATVDAYRYWAFLSYSHADAKAADRLHRWLEHFRLPDSLVGQEHQLGTIPKRMSPIFRDRSELAASSNLNREIEEALAASRYLIVLCSPAAAKSRWVDQEIRSFKRLHGEDRVLAAIVAGEPFSEGEDECFPPALRHRVGADGKLSRQKIEPIAADLREDRDGQRIGSLKIAAGMLEVGLDDLVQRDQQRRQKRMTWIVAASLVGMAFTTGLSVVAINARDAARDERRQADGLVGFLLGDLKDELEPIGRLDALDEVGARALAYYERQDKSDLTDDQLAQRSKALTLLGQIATERGDSNGALARYREALRSTSELVDRSPNDPQRLFDHAQNVFWMGELSRQRGGMKQAEAHYRQYKLLADRMVAAEPNNPKWRMEELYAKQNIGIVLYYQRRFADSARELDAALPVLERLARNRPQDSTFRSERAGTLAWIGDARRDEGRLDLAMAARSQQIDLLRQQVAASSGDVSPLEELIPAQQAYGILLADTGRLSAALRQLRLAMSEADALLEIEPDNANWRGYAADVRLELATTLLALGRITEANSVGVRGCALATELRAKDRSQAVWHNMATTCLMVRARLALAAGDTSSAMALAEQGLRSALTERSTDAIADRYRVASAWQLIGDVRRRQAAPEVARQAWTAGLELLPPGINERPRELAGRAALMRRLGLAEDVRLLELRLNRMGFRRVI